VTSFGPVAPYYDDLMKQVPYRMWCGYYLLLLSQQDAHPKTILDVCCGTGTMCEMLTREGFEMAGVDISPGMIEVARKKAAKAKLKIDYTVADAAEFDLGRKFDAALSFFDSLNNITDSDRLQAAFQNVAAHLKPGGSFIFDLNTAYAFETKLFDQTNLASKGKLKYDWVGDWDPETRQITVRMKFWWNDEEFEETHIQRAYAEGEINSMLGAAGFEDIRAYHSYSLNHPRFKSDRIHYAAIRSSH
jgi:SAM-dependent methyltransferase